MKLKLKETTIRELNRFPGEEQTTQVLVLAATLTPTIAQALGVGECYDERGVPRHWDSYPSPSLRINGADLTLGEMTVRANMIHKFKVTQPKKGSDRDTTLEVTMRCHFDGSVALNEWMDDTNKATFVAGINARQEAFEFAETKEEDAGEEPAADERQGTLASAAEMPADEPRQRRLRKV